MLTTGYDDTSALRANVSEMVLDWLAAGLDPAQCVIYKQSDVPEHAELTLMLSMTTPLGWLENNPTWKEQLQELAKTKHEQVAEGAGKASGVVAAKGTTAAQKELRTYGFLGYPVLQAADILLYHGTKVPVGQDQLPHLELTREIARKFNHVFGEIFAEPQPLLTPTPRVVGVDARKMSKSYGNAVDIYETEKALEKKIKSMYTDPTRKSATDPGHPEPCGENPPGCSVYAMHKLYADAAFVAKRGGECRAGKLGCGDCKKDLLSEMSGPFDEFRRRRESFAAAQVDAILAAGAEKARVVARKTMDEVRRAMRLR
jgi:tryptophanyl-tRNA synthetase